MPVTKREDFKLGHYLKSHVANLEQLQATTRYPVSCEPEKEG